MVSGSDPTGLSSQTQEHPDSPRICTATSLLRRRRSQELPSSQKGSCPCNPTPGSHSRWACSTLIFLLCSRRPLVYSPCTVPRENNGFGSAPLEPRPTPMQTDPESKTSSVWARGERSGAWGLGRSAREGSGKGLRLSSARCPRVPAQAASPRQASPGPQPVLRDAGLPPETHTAGRA